MKARSFFILLQILLLLLCNKVYSIDINFKYYMVENGLSSNTVCAIIQDSDGFIWVGTENGLNRFDGYQFLNFSNIPKNPASLVNNYVYALFEDNNKKLWIGTERGISIYDLRLKSFRTFETQADDGTVIKGRIQNIFSDEQKQIWINAGRQGVFAYNSEGIMKRYSFESEKNDTDKSIWINCIYKDKGNTIWASVNNTQYQIYKFDKANDKFVPAFPQIGKDILYKLTSYAILEDTFGTLWFGTWANGLYAIDKETGVKGTYLNTENVDKILHIHSITEYEPGKLLIGSNDGLTYFSTSPTIGNRREVHFNEPYISNRFVYPIYKDREGGLWVGTYYGGINYASPNRNYFMNYVHNRYENSISGNVISSFCEDKDGNLWIGTDDGGLNYFDVKSEKFTTYNPEKEKNSLSYHNIHALCIDDNKLWIGTYTGGLNVMDLTTKKFKHYYSISKDSTTLEANNIYSLYKDSRNNIWIGTTSGINLYDKENDNFKRMMIHNELTMDILQLGNRIWFATIGAGLYSYNLNTEEWNNYRFDINNTSSLISNNVVCLCLDDNNQLWIGTSSGLCRFDVQKESFEYMPMNFPSNSICNIFSDNGHLWITTTKGLIRFNPQNKRFNIFTKEDGLLSDQFTLKSGIKTTSGRIYVGTATGFNAFYPKQIIENRHLPQIYITDFQLFNKTVNIQDYLCVNENEIVLPHNKNAFSLEYTALSYYAPEKNEYAFILEGFDKNWNYVNKMRKATYTNVPPGNYIFRVKASNNDGIWNDTGLTMKITITPPFWWNSWSISFYIILAILILMAIFYYIKKKQERKNKEKIERIKNEQEKESYNSKINFFTTIAHEIRTPVSLIIGPLEQIVRNNTELPEKVTADLDIIDRNSQRLLTLVNQLLDFRKIERETIGISLKKQNLYVFLLGIYNRFQPFVENKKIEFKYTYYNKHFLTGIDNENLTKVVSNLLNNASKYTKDFIELSFNINQKDNTYEISVTDNGLGISDKEKENIFKPFYQIAEGHKSGTGIGLYLVKSIVDAFEGEIRLSDRVGGGLIFTVVLPIVEVDNSGNLGSIDTTSKDARLDIEENEITNQTDEDKSTLLIVEDNIDMQTFLYNGFKEAYFVLLASNGLEAIKVLEKTEIDIIVSDIMMPEMDGVEFCNRLKHNSLWNHIPFIMLTAKTDVSSKIKALEIGADAYIEKPFSIQHLSAQIKNLIESRKNLLKKFTETPFASLRSIAGNDSDGEFLAKLNEIIEKNISNEAFSVENMAEALCISSSGLFAKIKNLTGITPNKLLLLFRLKKAAELLIENKYRINEICYMVGFSNPSYFAKCFHKQYGVLPKDFKESRKN